MPILNNGLPAYIDNSVLKRENASSNAKKGYRWWLAEDEEDLYKKVWPVAEQIYTNMGARRRQNYLYALMYNDVDTNLYSSNQGVTVAHNSSADSASQNKITLNVIQNCVDTASSLIATNRPRPQFLADSGVYQDDVKAEQLTTYVQGVIDDMKLYELAERCFTDGCIYGTGAIKFYVDEEAKKVKAEWVWIGELLVDDLEGYKELPSQIHQRKYISRDVLCEMFPEHADKIMDANSGTKGDVQSRTVSDELIVLESWHLKSGPKAKDGLHCITIPNCTLLVEPYNKEYYPIVFWRWYHNSVGFWGRGIPQEIGKIQRVINKLARVIDQSQELLGVPVITSPKSAMISDDQIMNNEIGHWIEFAGEVGPQFLTPPAVQAELYQHLWALEERAYQYVGISQGMAQGTVDGRLRSAPAIREATDLATGRFQRIGQRWEAWFTDIAQIIVDLSKDLYKSNKDLSVVCIDDNGIIRIKWKDVDMDKDRFKIKCFEISALPKTPQGKMDAIGEWGSNGWIPKPVMMSLLGIPDLNEFAALETSTYDLVRSTIAKIKQTAKYGQELKPIPQQDLQLTINLATQEKVLAKKQGLSDEVLSLIDNYLADANYLLQQQMPPPPPPQVAGPMGPQPGGPMQQAPMMATPNGMPPQQQ